MNIYKYESTINNNVSSVFFHGWRHSDRRLVLSSPKDLLSRCSPPRASGLPTHGPVIDRRCHLDFFQKRNFEKLRFFFFFSKRISSMHLHIARTRCTEMAYLRGFQGGHVWWRCSCLPTKGFSFPSNRIRSTKGGAGYWCLCCNFVQRVPHCQIFELLMSYFGFVETFPNSAEAEAPGSKTSQLAVTRWCHACHGGCHGGLRDRYVMHDDALHIASLFCVF